MNEKQPPMQLQEHFDAFVAFARERDLSPDILSALQELSELPKHLSIDLEGIVRQAAMEGARNRSISQEILELIRKLFRDDIRCEMESTLEHLGSAPFLHANAETLPNFLIGLVSKIEASIRTLKSGSAGYKDEAEKTYQRLMEQEQAYFTLQQECEIRISHVSRDYQMVLTRLGPAPTGKLEQEIQSILEDGLEDMGITVLWERPEGDSSKYFLIQNDSTAETMHVSRPCLVHGENVVHQGVVVTRAAVD